MPDSKKDNPLMLIAIGLVDAVSLVYVVDLLADPEFLPGCGILRWLIAGPVSLVPIVLLTILFFPYEEPDSVSEQSDTASLAPPISTRHEGSQ